MRMRMKSYSGQRSSMHPLGNYITSRGERSVSLVIFTHSHHQCIIMGWYRTIRMYMYMYKLVHV